MDVATNMANGRSFNAYTYKNEMIGDAIENCLMYIHNYDPDNIKKNPFGYISRIIYFAFLRRIEEEQEEQYVKLKATALWFQSNIMDINSLDGTERHVYDNNLDFIEKFERKKLAKKTKKKRPPGLEEFMEKDDEPIAPDNQSVD